ncbi:sterol desaturase family protein [Ferrimicrobium acidiphilum]|uniref:Fatty acid hydroxylase superfamily protein n=1 Tax=Ferrimicrobium acidiphilum DSM 19497 TaxID=1121877 RepID=A0A0D8FXW9_9ACTN|nr:sterol desaturase family protein [Ferrimicrobium acidiphilum]KJE77799.1 fatty acid hydroxylase superfamily protein [Ferrimicrobium acidiphilum DSM 19497]
MTFVAIIIATFIVMEPVAYLAHRAIMHGVGWVLHASHHLPRETRFEANDLFPIGFALPTIILFWQATSHHPILLPIAIGITLYGAAYSFVHDFYIHQRLGAIPKVRYLEYLKRCHALHHLYNEEPYGMLAPVIPARLRPMMQLEVVQNWNPSSIKS